jgi:hypothetical protein
MRKTIGWLTLILLGALTLFDALILCLGQFGHDFNQGGAEPHGLRYGWLALVCKVVGLGISLRTGLLMIVGGLLDWVYGVVFIQMQGQHQSLGNAVSNSSLDGIYVVVAVTYILVTGRWGIRMSRVRKTVDEH